MTLSERAQGCLLAGAMGDALGWPVEFLSWPEIQKTYGPGGICEPPPGDSELAEITDDTQMTIFTAVGLLSGGVPALYGAYLDWLSTQRALPPSLADRALGSGLARLPGLCVSRAPGTTCLGALASGQRGNLSQPINDSAGCGGVMRAAPVGLWLAGRPDFDEVFAAGCASAIITHGNPRGYLPAGMLALMVALLAVGTDLRTATAEALAICQKWPGSGPVCALVARALASPASRVGAIETAGLGEGWVGDEALAIALASCLGAPDDLLLALRIAVNHSGDSDSTGSIAGNLLGCLLGPPPGMERVELSRLVAETAASLAAGR